MSYLGRLMGTFALVVLTLTFVSAPAQAQVSAVKDGWLVMKIHSEFVDEDVLAGSNIDVDVKNGVVTLQGTVPSEAARARAIASAKNNDGVKNVVDQLRIAPARGERERVGAIADRTGDRTERAAERAGEKTERAAEKTERAAERAGEKTERAAERAGDKTANAANRTGRAIDDGWIKSKIYAQYMTEWNTVLDDSDIDIDVNDNTVTLSGTVKSAAAKTKAVAIAKATDGVKSVKDNLKVVATK